MHESRMTNCDFLVDLPKHPVCFMKSLWARANFTSVNLRLSLHLSSFLILLCRLLLLIHGSDCWWFDWRRLWLQRRLLAHVRLIWYKLRLSTLPHNCVIRFGSNYRFTCDKCLSCHVVFVLILVFINLIIVLVRWESLRIPEQSHVDLCLLSTLCSVLRIFSSL